MFCIVEGEAHILSAHFWVHMQLQWIIPKLLTDLSLKTSNVSAQGFLWLPYNFLNHMQNLQERPGHRYWATHKESEMRMGDEDFSFSAP